MIVCASTASALKNPTGPRGLHHRWDTVEDLDPSERQAAWQLRLFLLLLRSTKRDAFLDHAKANVIERRRLIRAERIIAVALAHDNLFDPVEDRLAVLFLNADSEELRPNLLPENHLVARITFDPIEEGACSIAEPSLFSERIGNLLNDFLNGSTKLVL
jgi:hypothetical protein